MAVGRFSDGRTARVVAVAASFGDDALTLAAADGEAALTSHEATWPYARIRLLDADVATLRLGRSDEPDYRLVLPAQLRAQLAERAPKVLTRRGQSTRSAILIAAGVAASVALLAGVFLGIPWAARPLAAATPANVEARLGDLAERQLEGGAPPCEGPRAQAALAALEPLSQRLETAVGVDGAVSYRFIDEEAPNAVTLPGARIWITSGLLEALDSSDELAAVIAHELAHVKARDGLEGFYRRAGLGVALEVMTGGSGVGQQVILLSGDLAELGYTRGQEARADRRALEALDAAGFDPAALARAFAAMERSGEEA